MSDLTCIVRGSGPGLLLAHGGGGGIELNYGAILDGLAERHTVVGPDYPGSGRTPRASEPLTLDALADQLVETAVEEGLERFAIAGFSMGGPVAIRATTRHPHRVTALVLTASFAYPNPRLRLAMWLWRELIQDGDPRRLATFLTLISMGPGYLDGFSQEQVDEALKGTADTVPPGTADHIDLAERMDVRGDLSEIAVPTLVISTTADVLATPYHHRQVAEGIPGAQFAEIDTGHLPFVERPAEWLALIDEFLGSVHA
jgi:pimeloyl-ACP methyl ester carboxylesterase